MDVQSALMIRNLPVRAGRRTIRPMKDHAQFVHPISDQQAIVQRCLDISQCIMWGKEHEREANTGRENGKTKHT
jgi:hypothetical protein